MSMPPMNPYDVAAQQAQQYQANAQQHQVQAQQYAPAPPQGYAPPPQFGTGSERGQAKRNIWKWMLVLTFIVVPLSFLAAIVIGFIAVQVMIAPSFNNGAELIGAFTGVV